MPVYYTDCRTGYNYHLVKTPFLVKTNVENLWRTLFCSIRLTDQINILGDMLLKISLTLGILVFLVFNMLFLSGMNNRAENGGFKL